MIRTDGGLWAFNRKYLTNFIKKPLTDENTNLIFPFDLVMGFVNSTEAGVEPNDYKINDFSSFQRIFTGKDNLLAKWDGAYNVYKNNDNDTFLTKEFKVGKSFRGFNSSKNTTTSFSTSSANSLFKGQFTNESFIFDVYDEFDETTDMFKFYIVPEKQNGFVGRTTQGKSKLMYISNATKYYNGNKTNEYLYTRIELTDINNRLGTSGRAIEEFIQFSAPGDGYAYPIVYYDKKGKRQVELDNIRNRDIPVSSSQIEFNGPIAFNNMIAFGRPTITDGSGRSYFNPKIEPSRILLAYEFLSPIPSEINTKTSIATDYVPSNSLNVELYESFKDWKTAINDTFDLSQRQQYEGVIIDNEKLDDLIKRNNPIESGSTKYVLWNKSFEYQLDPVGSVGTVLYNIYSNEYISQNATTKLQQLEFQTTDKWTMPDFNNHNFFIYKHMGTLPMSQERNIPFRLSDVPIIGGILNKMFLGINPTWNTAGDQLNANRINMLIPTDILEFGNALMAKTKQDDIFVPLDIFTNANNNDNITYSGIKYMACAIRVSHTHLFSKTINGVSYTFDTIYLGQDRPLNDFDGTTINWSGITDTKLYWNESCKAVDPYSKITNFGGYSIDAYDFKVLSDNNVRVSFYDKDISIWSGTYLSQSKFSGQVRDWDNPIKMSDWNTNDSKTLDFPKALVIPDAPSAANNWDITSEVKTINNKYTLDIRDNVYQKGSSPFPELNNYHWVPDIKSFGNVLPDGTLDPNISLDLFNTYNYIPGAGRGQAVGLTNKPIGMFTNTKDIITADLPGLAANILKWPILNISLSYTSPDLYGRKYTYFDDGRVVVNNNSKIFNEGDKIALNNIVVKTQDINNATKANPLLITMIDITTNEWDIFLDGNGVDTFGIHLPFSNKIELDVFVYRTNDTLTFTSNLRFEYNVEDIKEQLQSDAYNNTSGEPVFKREGRLEYNGKTYTAGNLARNNIDGFFTNLLGVFSEGSLNIEKATFVI